jgi:hypothetical protein
MAGQRGGRRFSRIGVIAVSAFVLCLVGLAAPGGAAAAARVPAAKHVADLWVSISGPSSAADGSSFTETITVANHGPDASGSEGGTAVTIPRGTTVSSAPGATEVDGVEIWSNPSLADGASLTDTITYTVGANAQGTVIIDAAATTGTGVKDSKPAHAHARTSIALG